jgi:hypothetical protein
MQSESMSSRSSLIALAVVAVVLATAGCGSSNKGSTAATATFGGNAGEDTVTPQTVYKVTLAGGKASGASQASGLAIVTTEPASGRLCWNFSQLKNVAPTGARIYRPVSGNPGFELGHGYEPNGCVYAQRLFLEVFAERGFVIGIKSGRSGRIALSGALAQGASRP